MHLARDAPAPLSVTGGHGARLTDDEGREYMDLTGGQGVASVGYGRDDVADAVATEAARGFYAPSSLDWPPWEDLAERLARFFPGRDRRVHRATGGSEAVENGLMALRTASGRDAIVTMEHVYHGHTFGAAAAGDAWTRSLGRPPPGFVKVPNAVGGDWERVLEALDGVARERDGLAGFFTVPAQNSWPVEVPTRAFWSGVQDLCEDRDLLLGVDEVFTGFGRCGAMFACDLLDIDPDVVCLGKGITGGYAPLGATVVTREVDDAGDFVADATFGWHPVAVAAALKVLEVLEGEDVPANARRMGDRMRARLRELEGRGLARVRGVGLIVAADVVTEDGEADAQGAQRVKEACQDRGVLLSVQGKNVLFLSPPLTIDAATVDEAMGVLEDVLVDRGLVQAA